MSDKLKEEFYLIVNPEQLARSGEDFIIGTRFDTGEELNVRLFDSEELSEHGMNPINRGSYKRPEIQDIMACEGTGQNAGKVIKKFRQLSSEPMRRMPEVVVPEALTVKVNTSVRLNDNWVGSRWIEVLNGEGTEMLQLDKDASLSANGLNDTGRYLNIVRPSKFREPGNLFVEMIDAKAAISSSADSFSQDLATAIDKSFELKYCGAMPMAHIVCFDSDNRAVKFDFSYVSNGETKTYSSVQATVRTSAKTDSGWKNFNNGKESVAAFLASDNGKIIDNYLLDHPDAKIAIIPAANFIMGPNVRNGILNDSKKNNRLTDIRFNPYEIDIGGKYPLQAYNKGQFSVRQGSKKKGSYYVTDFTTTDPFNKPVSLSDVAKFVVGINPTIEDSLKTVKESAENVSNEKAVTSVSNDNSEKKSNFVENKKFRV